MAVYFVRHGQSEFNATYDGEKDPMIIDASLTKLGITQAIEVRDKIYRLNIDRVITSPLTRAIQTAEIISGDKIPIEVWHHHREILKYSCDIGQSPDKLKILFPELTFAHLRQTWWFDQRVKYPKISKEPTHEFRERLYQFVEALDGFERTNVAVVGHGNAFQEILGFMLDHCKVHQFR